LKKKVQVISIYDTFLSSKIKIQPTTIVERQHIIDVKLTLSGFFFDKGNIIISRKILPPVGNNCQQFCTSLVQILY
jgi:hypothetical protein